MVVTPGGLFSMEENSHVQFYSMYLESNKKSRLYLPMCGEYKFHLYTHP